MEDVSRLVLRLLFGHSRCYKVFYLFNGSLSKLYDQHGLPEVLPNHTKDKIVGQLHIIEICQVVSKLCIIIL